MESLAGHDEDNEMDEPIGNWIIESNATTNPQFEELKTTVEELKSDIVRKE